MEEGSSEARASQRDDHRGGGGDAQREEERGKVDRQAPRRDELEKRGASRKGQGSGSVPESAAAAAARCRGQVEATSWGATSGQLPYYRERFPELKTRNKVSARSSVEEIEAWLSL